MEGFRFTLFNNLTLFVMAATVGMVAARARAPRKAVWPMAYWVLVLAFAAAFQYSLNMYLVATGILVAALLRYAPRPQPVRIAEFALLAYVFARCVGLLLMW